MDHKTRPLPEPRLEVMSGPMFSEKSHQLIGMIDRARRAGWEAVVFKPVRDSRANCVQSRNGKSVEAIAVTHPEEMLAHLGESVYVGIDEVQFFDISLVPVVLRLLKMGKVVYVAGLNLDFRGQPFETMMMLESYAQRIDRRNAVCVCCGSEWGSRSQRIQGGNETIQVGDSAYEARCIRCFTGDE